MSYKAKSLAYFTCLLIVSIAYYNTDRKGSSMDQNKDGVVKIEANQTPDTEAFQNFKIK